MKVLLLFGVLLAYSQASPQPEITQQALTGALNHCTEETHFDKSKIKNYSSTASVPENDEAVDFMACAWRELSVIEDGTFNHLQLKALLRYVLNRKYPSATQNNLTSFIDDAVKECKGFTEGGQKLSLRAIKYRNCIAELIKNHFE